MGLKNTINEINNWTKISGSKIFRDSYGVPFRITGADLRTKAGNEYIVLYVEHQDGVKTSRPLSAFRKNGERINNNEILNILKTQSFIEGKSTFDIVDKVNAWVKRNPYKYFVDKSGVNYTIINASPPDILHLMSESGIKIDKKTTSLIFNGEPLSDKNIYKALTESTSMDNQVFYGNIVQTIKNWVIQNPNKWFQNGETGKFQLIGAKTQNGITLLTLKNDSGIEKNISLNKLVFNNRKMTIGNAIEFLNLSTKFDNTIRFGDEIEIANEWLKQTEPIFSDKNGNRFKIEKVFRDKDSQIKFKLSNLQGQTVSRNAYSFIYNGNITIKDGDIVNFLKNATQFDNAVIFENAWQQGRAYEPIDNPHYLPNFNDLNINSLLRLPNGQCAKVIDIHTKQTSSSKQKNIDIVIEDGTIIKGISQTRYNSGLVNINTNKPILNVLPLCQDGQYECKDIRREMRQLLSEKSTLGNRSNIEFKYLYYLQKLGFHISDASFFEKYFHINDRRLPDSYLLTNKNMVIFEFDGGSGHGGVHRDLNEDILKDKEKNKMYSQIVENAKTGYYLPQIETVTVIRVRGNGVPLLNTDNIHEINYPKCSNEELMIPQVISQIAKIIDKQTSLSLNQQLMRLYPDGINLKQETNKLNDFVDEMVGKMNPNMDKRMGEISQMIGFGSNDIRTGQYMMIIKVEQKESGIVSDNDKVTVIFEDGRTTKTSYEKFKKGTINSSRFNKIIDCSSKKFKYTTLAQIKKEKDFAYSVGYYNPNAITETLKHDETISLNEILQTRHMYPVINGTVLNRNTIREIGGLQSYVYKSKSLADKILEKDYSDTICNTSNPIKGSPIMGNER